MSAVHPDRSRSRQAGPRGMAETEIPRLRDVIKRGWVFLVPLAALVYTFMFAFWEPEKPAWRPWSRRFSSARCKRTRGRRSKAFSAASKKPAEYLDIAVVTALAGLVIGAFQLSGLTFKLALLLVNTAGGSTIVLLILTAVYRSFSGCRCRRRSSTSCLQSWSAQRWSKSASLRGRASVFLLLRHAVLITPPDCIATYAAASIARADFWKSGWTGMRLGIVAYIVPFISSFIRRCSSKAAVEIGAAIVTAVIGVIFLSVGVAGYLFRRLGWIKRALMISAGLLLIPSASTSLWLGANPNQHSSRRRACNCRMEFSLEACHQSR